MEQPELAHEIPNNTGKYLSTLTLLGLNRSESLAFTNTHCKTTCLCKIDIYLQTFHTNVTLSRNGSKE